MNPLMIAELIDSAERACRDLRCEACGYLLKCDVACGELRAAICICQSCGRLHLWRGELESLSDEELRALMRRSGPMFAGLQYHVRSQCWRWSRWWDNGDAWQEALDAAAGPPRPRRHPLQPVAPQPTLAVVASQIAATVAADKQLAGQLVPNGQTWTPPCCAPGVVTITIDEERPAAPRRGLVAERCGAAAAAFIVGGSVLAVAVGAGELAAFLWSWLGGS